MTHWNLWLVYIKHPSHIFTFIFIYLKLDEYYFNNGLAKYLYKVFWTYEKISHEFEREGEEYMESLMEEREGRNVVIKISKLN